MNQQRQGPQQGPQKPRPLLFYSDDCDFSKKIIAMIVNSPLKNMYQFVNVDRTEAPPEIVGTPSIYHNGKIFSGNDAFGFVQFQFKRFNEVSQQQQQINRNTQMGQQMGQMGQQMGQMGQGIQSSSSQYTQGLQQMGGSMAGPGSIQVDDPSVPKPADLAGGSLGAVELDSMSNVFNGQATDVSSSTDFMTTNDFITQHNQIQQQFQGGSGVIPLEQTQQLQQNGSGGQFGGQFQQGSMQFQQGGSGQFQQGGGGGGQGNRESEKARELADNLKKLERDRNSTVPPPIQRTGGGMGSGFQQGGSGQFQQPGQQQFGQQFQQPGQQFGGQYQQPGQGQFGQQFGGQQFGGQQFGSGGMGGAPYQPWESAQMGMNSTGGYGAVGDPNSRMMPQSNVPRRSQF